MSIPPMPTESGCTCRVFTGWGQDHSAQWGPGSYYTGNYEHHAECPLSGLGPRADIARRVLYKLLQKLGPALLRFHGITTECAWPESLDYADVSAYRPGCAVVMRVPLGPFRAPSKVRLAAAVREIRLHLTGERDMALWRGNEP